MNQTNTSSGNGNHHRSAVDVLEDNRSSGTTIYDPSNPLLAPPKEIEKTKQKGRTRRLVIVCFVFLALTGAAFFLYRSLRVNRVNVTVQADNRRDTQSPRSKGESKNSENDASTDAINLTRKALGSDNANAGNVSVPSSNPTPTPDKSNESVPEVVRSLGGTFASGGNDNGPNNPKIGFQPRTGGGSEPQSNGTTSANQEVAQSHANSTQTLFVDAASPKLDLRAAPLNGTTAAQTKLVTNAAINITPAVLPPFGTMLPVRTQGVIFTLRNNSYARLELIRDVAGNGWSLPKGTVLV
ncbi:MAG TPA: hypothetical protein VE863_17245, partial [Pyrinomonadaceae bacterium]|nr:hypothetical protein [Pyrinomonadaceae bacterium]